MKLTDPTLTNQHKRRTLIRTAQDVSDMELGRGLEEMLFEALSENMEKDMVRDLLLLTFLQEVSNVCQIIAKGRPCSCPHTPG